jgi:hypothetical protein
MRQSRFVNRRDVAAFQNKSDSLSFFRQANATVARFGVPFPVVERNCGDILDTCAERPCMGSHTGRFDYRARSRMCASVQTAASGKRNIKRSTRYPLVRSAAFRTAIPNPISHSDGALSTEQESTSCKQICMHQITRLESAPRNGSRPSACTPTAVEPILARAMKIHGIGLATDWLNGVRVARRHLRLCTTKRGSLVERDQQVTALRRSRFVLQMLI